MRDSPIVPDAVGRRSFSLSSYGFVSVPARNANLAGLRLRIRGELESSREREQEVEGVGYGHEQR